MAHTWGSPERFADRREAGQLLARRLAAYANRDDVVVLGLPRGGVPVAFEVASALHAALDVFVVRKLGFPGHAEFAMGAIASGGVRVLNEEIDAAYMPSKEVIDRIAQAEGLELERREHAYRNGRPPARIEGRVAILVDDGLATGSTMRAAVLAVRRLKPSRIVVAVPVGSVEARDALAAVADEMVCLRTPDPFSAVGLWYVDFGQTTDEEVCELLATPTGVRAQAPQGG
ncbi:MAG: phosphoribosyltransferase [Acidobacteria bacterium]|nr:phosphoribosyltransferase [Acidobacteriota bacterium]